MQEVCASWKNAAPMGKFHCLGDCDWVFFLLTVFYPHFFVCVAAAITTTVTRKFHCLGDCDCDFSFFAYSLLIIFFPHVATRARELYVRSVKLSSVKNATKEVRCTV